MIDLRIALMQCESRPADVAGNLQRLDGAARQAARAGAQLLVTPEMFLTGYDIGRAAAAALAETPGGPRETAVAAIARQHGIAIVFGHPSRDEEGSVFNTAVCVDAAGQGLGRYRKTHLFGELDRAMFSAGAGNEPLFELHGWTLGLLICFDVEFPENARRLALLGARLIVVPTANMVGFDFVAEHLVPTRAYENQVFVAYANYCGREGSLSYNGLSRVVAPDGGLLAQGGGDAPCLLLADLTVDRWAAGQALNSHLAVCRAAQAATAISPVIARATGTLPGRLRTPHTDRT